MLSSWRYPWLGLVGLAAVALLLAGRGIVLAAPTTQLTARYIAQPAPTGPDDPAWSAAAVVEVPLTAQAGIPSALPAATVPSAKIRALHDGQTISFLVEWSDATRDAQAIKPDQFRDAVALQFGVGEALPAICMGAPAGLANLWHWKADWQEDIDKGFQELPQVYPNFFKEYYPYVTSGTPPYNVATDFTSPGARSYLVGQAAGNILSATTRRSPVEELLAAGFGSATTKTAQNVGGTGVWANGVWRVTFSRPLTVQDTDAPTFADGKSFSIAVAVWNGSNQEVGARKQTSNFVTMAIGPQGITPAKPSEVAGAKPEFKVAAPAPAAAKAQVISDSAMDTLLLSILLIPTTLAGLAILWITRRTG